MTDSLIDPTDPTIRKLEEDGFRISFQAFLRDGRTSVAFIAHNKQTKRTFNGRSRAGDRDEALLGLARDAGIKVPMSPEPDNFDLDPFAGL